MILDLQYCGFMCTGDDNVVGLLENYYQTLFASSNLREIEEVIIHSSKVVTNDMNNMLGEDFTRTEVEEALKQMAHLKAPRLDGMPPIFFQHYWPSIRDEVTNAVLSCLNLGKILPSLNHTFLTLIPEVKSFEKVFEFRPIALCKYKLISKVLANR